MNFLTNVESGTEEHPVGDRQNLVVIGGGPVGIKFANELSQLCDDFAISVFSNEASSPYQRARLSQLLAGQIKRDDIDISLSENAHTQIINRAISSIDFFERVLIDSTGAKHSFDQLVFATGARSFVPSIEGVDLKGVFRFRSLSDTESLLARKVRTRHVVVVGGGLLGIETAVAMSRYQTKVSLIHQGEWLLNRQLDEYSSRRLEKSLEAEGINVHLNSSVRGINGESGQVSSVKLRDGLEMDCDSVVLCCGSSPNIELARDAKIRVNRGIIVSDTLETSQLGVYAIGECCEHAEQTYGLLTPGYDQAKVLANRLAGEKAVYQGSEPQSLLKVLDFPLRTFGEPVNYQKSPFTKELIYKTQDTYFKLVMAKGRLLGGIAIGELDEFDAVFDAYLRGETFSSYRRLMFKLSGRLWPLTDQNAVEAWSDQRTVCRCRQVALAQVKHAVEAGSTTLSEIGETTHAGTTCGGCQPLLARVLEVQTGTKVALEPSPLYKTSTLFALLAAVFAVLIWALPGIQVGSSVTAASPLEWLWNDKFWKQVSGFTLLGLSLAGLVVSLRKRVKWTTWGRFIYWRFAHIVLGALCVGVLMLHTGLHTGTNLNRWLIINFTLVLVLGSITSLVLAFAHKLQGRKQELMRSGWNWLHIIAVWPLPLLLAAHIITVYKY